jgi:hypothetical protein
MQQPMDKSTLMANGTDRSVHPRHRERGNDRAIFSGAR